MSVWYVLCFALAPAATGVQPKTPADEWAQIESKFQKANEAWIDELAESTHGSGMVMPQPGMLQSSPGEKFRPRVQAFANKHSKTSAAIPALHWLVMNDMGFSGMGDAKGTGTWALDQLTRTHARDPAISDYLQGLRFAVLSVGEDALVRFLSKVTEENSDREVRGFAQLRLAELLFEGSPLPAMFGAPKQPENRSEKKDRAKKILRHLLAEYDGTKLAKETSDYLYAVEHLQVGMAAPELAGSNVDGQPLRLSDCRGKIVVVTFWASWCVPCIQGLPLERELMRKLAKKPFTFLGVNADEDRATARKIIKKEGITWPTIWDGPPPEGEICRKWNVRGFPATYVIDHEGIIRRKNVFPHELENVVNSLLVEMLD